MGSQKIQPFYSDGIIDITVKDFETLGALKVKQVKNKASLKSKIDVLKAFI